MGDVTQLQHGANGGRTQNILPKYGFARCDIFALCFQPYITIGKITLILTSFLLISPRNKPPSLHKFIGSALLRHVRLLQHQKRCCRKTICAAGGDVTVLRHIPPRCLLRMRAAAYCRILHCGKRTGLWIRPGSAEWSVVTPKLTVALLSA